MPEVATTLLFIGTLAYGLAFALTLFRLLKNREPARNLNFVVIIIGWLLQSGGIWLRSMDAGSCPIRNPFEVLQFVSWSIIVVYLFTGKVFRLSLFGTGCAVVAALLSAAAFVFTHPAQFSDTSRLGMDPWIETHAALALFSYGIFGLLAVVSGLYLLQNYSLKHKRSFPAFRFLPSIMEMELVINRLLSMAAVVFSLAMIIGAVHWVQHLDVLSSFKLIFTLLLWGGYLVVWGLHWIDKLYGKHLALCCLLLFIFALLILWPVESDRGDAPNAALTRIACSYHVV